MTRHTLFLCVLSLWFGMVPSSTYAEDPEIATEAIDEFEDEGELGDDALSEDAEVWDPVESINRTTFSFNDTLDEYLLEPVAEGYDAVVPETVQIGVGNFFENLGYPSYLVSDLVQLKFSQVAHHTGRFLINSTVGLFGVIDVAKEFGLEAHKEDFGVALAYYGVPAGPYIVLPLLGPSNLRDGVGRAVDFFLDPLGVSTYSSISTGTETLIGVGSGLRIVDQRAGLLEAITAGKESSLDYYLFVRSSYYQFRRGLLNDGTEAESKEVELLLSPQS